MVHNAAAVSLMATLNEYHSSLNQHTTWTCVEAWQYKNTYGGCQRGAHVDVFPDT